MDPKTKPEGSGRNGNEFDRVWQRPDIQGKIVEIKDILIDDRADILAEDICRRMLSFVWFLPASEGHHHAREFGLFLHSIETAIESLKRFDQKIYFEYRGESSGDIDSFETRRRRPHAQYSHFIAGLLHDIGKIVMYDVSAKGHEAWKPQTEHLYNYSMRTGCDFNDVKQRQFEYYLHQKTAPFFASRLLYPEDYSYMGADNVGDVLNAIGYKPYTGNIYITTQEDMKSVAADVSASATKTDVIGELLNVLRDMFKTGQIAINSQGARAWVLEQYTAITVSVLKEATQILGGKGKKVPDMKVIWGMLKDREYIEHEGWNCIYTMTMESLGRPTEYKVVKIRNKILWGDDKMPDICNQKLSFRITGS